MMLALADLSLLAFAFTAGVFTFFAPCAYPLLPGYLSYYLGRTAGASSRTARRSTTDAHSAPAAVSEAATVTAAHRVESEPPSGDDSLATGLGRAAFVGALVSLGVFLVFGLLGGVVAALGARVLAEIAVLELVVGLALVGVGAVMAAGWKPTLPTVTLPARRRSGAGYVLFGIAYGAAAAGCTAPVFIAVALQGLAGGPVLGVATLAAYAAGMSSLLIVLTVLTALGREELFRRVSARPDRIYRVAGGLLVLAGAVQVYFYLFRFDGLA